ncbi:MAG: T9SS type A sorting domain-containing protein [Bacteroidetes bacterium]|nr:T9SS type A sorting domain-containing protein [Bacteroidota bacterium]
MKKIYLLFLGVALPFFISAQCFTQIQFTNILCNGMCTGSATAFPVGTSPYTYLWSPGGMTTQNVTGLCAGGYTVTVVDAVGCTSTASCTITQPPVLSVFATTMPASCSSCCDGTGAATASGGTPPYTYMWSPSGGTGPNATGLCVGNYTVCVTDANGCTACQMVTVAFTAGMNVNNAVTNFDLFPDPAENNFTATAEFSSPTESLIVITDQLGQTVMTRNISSSAELKENIDVSGLAGGIYFVTLKTENGTSINKLIKN